MVWKKSLFLLSAVILVVVSLNFVFSEHKVFPPSFTINEDTSTLFNITINNTDQGTDGNITQVNITFYGFFNFTDKTNATNAVNWTFTNTTTVLNWYNTTGYLINGSVNYTFFRFNLTAPQPGIYNLSIATRNGTGTYETNLTVTVNDITKPQITLLYPLNGVNYSASTMYFNISATDNVNVSGCWFTLTSGLANYTMTLNATNTGFNATNASIADGSYTAKYYCNDTSNLVNNSEQAVFIKDVSPPNVSTPITPLSNWNYSGNVLVNVSINGSFLQISNVFFNITNSSGSQNITYVASQQATPLYWNATIDTTLFRDGVYNIIVYANDSVNNLNKTIVIYNLVFDNTPPNVSTPLTPLTWGNYSGNVLVNVSVNDSRFPISGVFFNITNSSGSQNITYVASQQATPLYWNATIDTTLFKDGVYNITVYANDSVNNLNKTTIIYGLTFDNTPPAITAIYPTNGLNIINGYFDISATDNVNVSGCWFTLTSGLANYTMTVNSTNTGFNYTNASIADGSYTAKYYCNDTLNNINYSTQVVFAIDATAPVITMISPANGSTITPNSIYNTNITFNFTISDATATNCSLILNGQKRYFNSSATIDINGPNYMTNTTGNITNYWNISCTDIVNNVLVSPTWTFYLASFEYNGTAKDENGNLLDANTTVNITIRSQAGWTVVAYVSAKSNETGWFNMSILSNSSWIYESAIFHKNITIATRTDYISKAIPGFPSQQMQMLGGTTYYLTPAGTINITAINAAGEFVPFKYQIKDTQLGYPIASDMENYYSEATVYVPRNRNYSIMIYPNMSMPVSLSWSNFSSASSYGFGPGSYNATTKTLQKQFNLTMNMAQVVGYVTNASGYPINFTEVNMTSLTVILYLIEPGNMVHSQYGAMPYNLIGGLGTGLNDTFNNNTGWFNVSIPATVEKSNILLFATANISNGTNSIYYGDFRNISLVYGTVINYTNFTMYRGLLGSSANITIDRIDGAAASQSIQTVKQLFTLKNATNSTLASTSAHVETTVDYSSLGALQFTWMTDVAQSKSTADFEIPLLNVTGIKEMNVFASGGPSGGNSQYAPRRVATMTAAAITANPNITIKTFNPGAIDNSIASTEIIINLYISNLTCDIPNPPAECSVASSATLETFNPMKAVMGGGKLSFRMGYAGSIMIHYVDVDLIASGPPDAVFDYNTGASSATSTFQNAVRFGSQGPTIYGYVLISMPYAEGSSTQTGLNENADVNISIPVLYDDNWNVAWNTSVNGRDASALAGNISHYSTYQSEWGYLMNYTNCTKTASALNSSTPCYIDTTNNRIWVRLPHFSGTGPQVNGAIVTATSSSSSTSSGGGSSAIYDLPVSVSEIESGTTKYIQTSARLKFTILNETHYVKLDSVDSKAKKATITVSSTPQTFTLAENEVKKVDMNGDSVYDLEVKVSNILSVGASVYVKKITEPIPVVTPEEKKEEKKTAGEQVKEAVEKAAGSKVVWIIVVAIVVAVIIVFFIYKKKKYSKKGY